MCTFLCLQNVSRIPLTTSNTCHVWYLLGSMNTFPASIIIIIYLSSSNPVDLYNRVDNYRRAGSTVTRAPGIDILCSPLAQAFSSPTPWANCSMLLTGMSSKSPGFIKWCRCLNLNVVDLCPEDVSAILPDTSCVLQQLLVKCL